MNKERFEMFQTEKILSLIQTTIADWHMQNEHRDPDESIVTEEIQRIKPFHEHRDNICQVIRELVITNTEIWHEEDKVRSMQDDVVLKAIRNINPLNQHRNDLIEEIDEIMIDELKNGKGRKQD